MIMRPTLCKGMKIVFTKKPSFSNVKENEEYLVEDITTMGIWFTNLKRKELATAQYPHLRKAWWNQLGA